MRTIEINGLKIVLGEGVEAEISGDTVRIKANPLTTARGEVWRQVSQPIPFWKIQSVQQGRLPTITCNGNSSTGTPTCSINVHYNETMSGSTIARKLTEQLKKDAFRPA